MIVVDSSVWISLLRDRPSRGVAALHRAIEADEVVIGDLIPLEPLQGARDEPSAMRLESYLRRFSIENMLDETIAVASALSVRLLRRKGITTRKTIDVIIATFCVQRGYTLLHEDSDFDFMAPLIGLTTV